MQNLIQIDRATNLHKNNSLQLLCFFLEESKGLYAVNVFKIREVIKYSGEISQIEFEDHSLIEGLITIRGLTLPLIDMHKWFHYDPQNPYKNLSPYKIKSKDPDSEVIMICEFSNLTIGIRIYQADRILDKKWTEIQQGINITGGAYNNKIVSHTHYFDGRLVQIVDMEKMLSDIFPWLEQEKDDEFEQLQKIESQKLVLIADDSPTALKNLARILDKLGLRHKGFINGQDLLDYLFSHNTPEIGLIITDLEMPETSGFEVIKQSKADVKTAHIPIIVNSSMSGSSNEELALSLNADAFINKSSPLEIQTTIQRLMK